MVNRSITVAAQYAMTPRFGAATVMERFYLRVAVTGSRQEEASRGENDLFARQTRRILEGCVNVISCKLWISFENLLDGFPCPELFKNEVDRNSRSLEARFAHHHIPPD